MVFYRFSFNKEILLSPILILLLSGCARNSELNMLKTKGVIKNQTSKPTSIEYKILPQDRLKIILYKDPEQFEVQSGRLGEDLNPTGVLVDAKGYLKLPLIGKVKVAGLTQTEASDKIEKKYKKKLTNPSVYLEILNKRLFVLGEVKKQGVVKIDKEKMSLFEGYCVLWRFYRWCS